MPYAQLHYPFENKEKFERNFPADFVAEGLDQVCALSQKSGTLHAGQTYGVGFFLS